MTCLLAVAVPSMGLIAADTRLNVRFRAGGGGGHDAGPLDVTYPDGSVLRVGATQRKIRRLRRGWAGGAGCFPIVHRCLDALAKAPSALEPDRVQALLDSVSEVEGRRVREHFAMSQDEIEQTAIFYVRVTDSGISFNGYRVDGQTVVPSGSQYVLNTPSETPGEVRAAVNSRISDGLRGPNDLHEVYENLRLIASVFHDVHNVSSTVSDILEVGLILKSTDAGMFYHHLHGDNETIARASDARLKGLLRSV